MKRISDEDGSRFYVCEECGFAYKEKEWAEKCEAWCSEKQGCNMDITKHALETAKAFSRAGGQRE